MEVFQLSLLRIYPVFGVELSIMKAGNQKSLAKEGGKTRGMMGEEQQHREINDGDVRTFIAPDDLSCLAVGST
eukprot:11477865-Ditylum_brightwellii.AAC.1